jgi:NAD(P)-dependent dehydrogenase (short-subunit alcohol dehydrogenase family)
MSEYALDNVLRTVDPPLSAGERTGRQLVHRVAKRGAQQVVTLRCVESDRGFTVECDVYPVGSLTVEPEHRGPYAFATETEARQFVDEATLALQYLGCDVFESGS